jgi:hypothetical protein
MDNAQKYSFVSAALTFRLWFSGFLWFLQFPIESVDSAKQTDSVARERATGDELQRWWS